MTWSRLEDVKMPKGLTHHASVLIGASSFGASSNNKEVGRNKDTFFATPSLVEILTCGGLNPSMTPQSDCFTIFATKTEGSMLNVSGSKSVTWGLKRFLDLPQPIYGHSMTVDLTNPIEWEKNDSVTFNSSKYLGSKGEDADRHRAPRRTASFRILISVYGGFSIAPYSAEVSSYVMSHLGRGGQSTVARPRSETLGLQSLDVEAGFHSRMVVPLDHFLGALDPFFNTKIFQMDFLERSWQTGMTREKEEDGIEKADREKGREERKQQQEVGMMEFNNGEYFGSINLLGSSVTSVTPSPSSKSQPSQSLIIAFGGSYDCAGVMNPNRRRAVSSVDRHARPSPLSEMRPKRDNLSPRPFTSRRCDSLRVWISDLSSQNSKAVSSLFPSPRRWRVLTTLIAGLERRGDTPNRFSVAKQRRLLDNPQSLTNHQLLTTQQPAVKGTLPPRLLPSPPPLQALPSSSSNRDILGMPSFFIAPPSPSTPSAPPPSISSPSSPVKVNFIIKVVSSDSTFSISAPKTARSFCFSLYSYYINSITSSPSTSTLLFSSTYSYSSAIGSAVTFATTLSTGYYNMLVSDVDTGLTLLEQVVQVYSTLNITLKVPLVHTPLLVYFQTALEGSVTASLVPLSDLSVTAYLYWNSTDNGSGTVWQSDSTSANGSVIFSLLPGNFFFVTIGWLVPLSPSSPSLTTNTIFYTLYGPASIYTASTSSSTSDLSTPLIFQIPAALLCVPGTYSILSASKGSFPPYSSSLSSLDIVYPPNGGVCGWTLLPNGDVMELTINYSGMAAGDSLALYLDRELVKNMTSASTLMSQNIITAHISSISNVTLLFQANALGVVGMPPSFTWSTTVTTTESHPFQVVILAVILSAAGGVLLLASLAWILVIRGPMHVNRRRQESLILRLAALNDGLSGIHHPSSDPLNHRY
eukprot:CAMPEP_0175040514 /NCGR_PEP_ID=MMETSP0052_2-20121109/1311_1 /TAXON_ID=51329 ORGANISM="Polytomella parva, Strain SAG 63-3" /NCGR_SAMPLE_ID=MMETSP0052_2 /ASSEMBLY_ACC=CAM_ASM_000194 /LENGTH=921 /DNA_ID=CAMNT_0016302745 /DNA_START=670 /DNA_END=3432 /DNA_ORIENTATION=-